MGSKRRHNIHSWNVAHIGAPTQSVGLLQLSLSGTSLGHLAQVHSAACSRVRASRCWRRPLARRSMPQSAPEIFILCHVRFQHEKHTLLWHARMNVTQQRHSKNPQTHGVWSLEDTLEGFTPLHWAVLSDNPKAWSSSGYVGSFLTTQLTASSACEGCDLVAQEWCRQRRQRCAGKDGRGSGRGAAGGEIHARAACMPWQEYWGDFHQRYWGNFPKQDGLPQVEKAVDTTAVEEFWQRSDHPTLQVFPKRLKQMKDACGP